MQQVDLSQPLFQPKYLNLEYIFEKIYSVIKIIFNFITDPHTWSAIGTISIILSLLFIAIIIFSLVRLREIQLEDKEEVNELINEALEKEKREKGEENPRWHYILTLTEAPNESDWRVAIMEADSMLEETLKDKGVAGDTVAELLESSRSEGYAHINDAWNAHLTRNKIAHEGADFPLSQIETRKIIKMYQNFLEDLDVI